MTPIGSHPLRSYTLFKPHYLTVPPVTEELLKALPVLVFAVFFSDDRKDILPAAMSVGIGFSIFQELARKYDGRFSYHAENGRFTASLILKGASLAQHCDL